MKRLIAFGVCLIVGTELLALILHDRRLVLAASGVAVALVLLNIRRFLGHGIQPAAEPNPTIWGMRCAAGCPPPRRRSGGRTPPGPTGTGICVRCSRDGSKSPRANGRPKIRRRFTPPAKCSSAPNCGNGSIRTTSPVPVTASPVPAVRSSKKFCKGWSRYEWRCDPDMSLPAATTTAHCEAVLDEIERAVVGKRSALTLILTAVLARGHVLIEDLPGLGKTLIARSFAAALGLRFTRVQFTPDLLPADLLGSTIYDMQSGRFAFRPRAHFHQPVAWPTRSTARRLRPRRRCWRRWPRAR